MAGKKTGATRRYNVLRDLTIDDLVLARGDVVELDPDSAALLIRDGMIREEV